MNYLTSRLALEPGQLTLWCVSFADIRDEGLLAAYWRLLSEAERQQANRFHFAKDRHRYLLTRALVRTVLSRYAPIAPEDWCFRATAHGRPEIANAGELAGRIVFNLSHTDSLIVLAIACGTALGVDVENIVERPAPVDIAAHFFAPSEVEALFRLPASERQARFFQYWTLKESYIKARGLGLSIPLDQFRFELGAAGQVELFTQPELNDPADRWRFMLLQPDPAYLIAVCAEGEQRLQLRKIVPLLTDEPFEATVLLQSGFSVPANTC
ncbi:4'-phosphopantetheinyl transferase superfamily protein [Chitinimonas arctica]|uniref:4'-phosphopantetheinyl transferase superfamily protein n=1 Tax=Chitinimonas arctica TaxID=2594795 RepID=A0A516SD17_9NEIS|nr:4'-phosphopantetheinyl transferase superfamily protein [Chitinimonas arctica]QDQ26030.1 4'-phosphopantetheinyl transferase superfamily protein [Chitinimonas arctica]